MDATLDSAKVEAFAAEMIGAINHAGLALMASLGHRTGLFDVMAKMPAATPAAIAAESGLSERYVREWLGAMATGRVVEHRPEDGTYFLPAEHAALLTRGSSPNVAASMQWVAVLGHVEDQVAEAFRHGRGVPYSAYHRFHEVMAEESGQSVVSALDEHILPLVPGLVDRLRAGIDVVDVGCGSGRAANRIAASYPASRVAGFDASAEAIAVARDEAARGGAAARFEVRDIAEPWGEACFDLVTAFDVIHDQARPDAVLRNIHAALRPGGTLLMQDISGSGHVHTDMGHMFGPFLYAISCMHCMSVSLASGGPGLGAMWGKETALAMLGEAGFRDVRVESLPHDPLNFYYLATR